MSPKLGETSKEILKTMFIRNDNSKEILKTMFIRNDNGMIFWDIHHSTLIR